MSTFHGFVHMKIAAQEAAEAKGSARRASTEAKLLEDRLDRQRGRDEPGSHGGGQSAADDEAEVPGAGGRHRRG